MSELNLYQIYSNDAVRDFGQSLRHALADNDYASLTELEYAEKKEDFAEVIKKFLRRNYKGWRPGEKSLENVMKLVDDHGVRLVRDAIVSHALTWKERSKEEGGTNV